MKLLLLAALLVPVAVAGGSPSTPPWGMDDPVQKEDTVVRGILVLDRKLEFIQVGRVRYRLSRETELYCRGYREELSALAQVRDLIIMSRKPSTIIVTARFKWRNGERVAQRIDIGRAPPGTPPGGIKGKTAVPRPKK